MAQQVAPAATPEKAAPVTTVAPVKTEVKEAPANMPPMGMAEHRAMKLKEKLKLTNAQAEQVKAILMDSEKQGQADREKFNGKPEDARKTGMDRRKVTDEKIMALLNAEQKKEYTQMREGMRGKEKPKIEIKPPVEGKK